MWQCKSILRPYPPNWRKKCVKKVIGNTKLELIFINTLLAHNRSKSECQRKTIVNYFNSPVETGHQLRQVSNLDLLCDGASNKSANTGNSYHLSQHFCTRCQQAECRCNTSSYTDLRQNVRLSYQQKIPLSVTVICFTCFGTLYNKIISLNKA